MIYVVDDFDFYGEFSFKLWESTIYIYFLFPFDLMNTYEFFENAFFIYLLFYLPIYKSNPVLQNRITV